MEGIGMEKRKKSIYQMGGQQQRINYRGIVLIPASYAACMILNASSSNIYIQEKYFRQHFYNLYVQAIYRRENIFFLEKNN